jgi:hypothetical protein
MASSPTHPAAEWARKTQLSPSQLDCTTAVMLKILDHKCKMTYEAQEALIAIYQVVKDREADLFGVEVHALIAQAEQQPTLAVVEQIHALRVAAEQRIPKPVMKAYKQFLREQLDDFQ